MHIKKFFLVNFLTGILLSSCSLNFDKDVGEVVTNLTKLPTPNITEVKDDYVYWNEVSNASSYVVKINNYQESVGNQLKYSISSIIDSRIEYDIPTELHIYVKAKGNQIMYSDSDWSSEHVFTYIKVQKTIDGYEKLNSPQNIQMIDNVLSWNEVPNANGYELKIEGNDEVFSTARTSYDMSTIFDDTTIFKVQLRALASQTANYSNSDWTVLTPLTFKKMDSKIEVGFKDIYKSNGLGRTIDLINSDSFKPKNGVGYIFDEDRLFKKTLVEETIRDQKATYEYGTSFDSFYGKWSSNLSYKVAKTASGIDVNNFMPGSSDFNIDAKGGYQKVSKEETKELYIKMHHNVVGKSVELLGHSSDYDDYASMISENFKSAVGKVVDEKTAEQFVNTWGTHVIMGAYYGAAFEASYYNISHNKYNESNWYIDIEAAIKSRLFFSDLDQNLNFDLNRDTNDNSENSLTKFEAHAIGGNGVALASDISGFQQSYEAWVNTLDESNYTLIDFPDNSLYCIWDFLDDSFANQKLILDNYLITNCQVKYDSVKNKINGLYDSDVVIQDGTASYPYLIQSPRDFSKVEQLDGENVYFKLDNDINLSDVTWTPINKFYGVFDGNNHKIIGLNVSSSTNLIENNVYIDFVNHNYGTIINLHFDNVQINGEHYLNDHNKRYIHAGIVGVNETSGLVYNVSINMADIAAKVGLETDKCGLNGNLNAYVGSIAGLNRGKIKYCCVTDSQLKGYTDAKFNTCDNYSIVGGIVGFNEDNGVLEDCASNNVNLYSYSTGGYYQLFAGSGYLRCWNGYITGYNAGSLIRCVSGIHDSESNIPDVYNFADFTGVEEYAGIISGKNEGTYTNVLCVKVDKLNVNGNETNNGSYIKDSMESIWSSVQLWNSWYLENNKLYFML